jgi:branched-chain amino acid transport system permease protein
LPLVAESPAQRIALLAGSAILVLLPWIAGWLAMPDLVTLGTQIAVYAIAAVSLDLLIGYAGLSSFGHAAFFGLGGYVTAILSSSAATPAFVAWPAAMLVAALAALVIGALSLRTAGVQFIMITLAFAEMLFFLFVSWRAWGGDDGLGFRRRNTLLLLDMRDDGVFYYVCLAVLVVVLGALYRLVGSRFGMALQGIRQDKRRMAALGLEPFTYQLAAFVLAGAIAGLAGALDANLLRFVSPDMLHWSTSGDLMVMVVLGGAGTLFGPVFGAAVLVALQSWLAQWTEHWMIVMGPVLVCIILFRRRGIFGGA